MTVTHPQFTSYFSSFLYPIPHPFHQICNPGHGHQIVTVWGIVHNTILQLYTLLFNNPVIRLNHCSFTTICVHYIITQYRASPEPQSPEPGLSPGISNPPPVTIPRRASPGTAEFSRTESLMSLGLSALPSRAAPRIDGSPLPRTGLPPE